MDIKEKIMNFFDVIKISDCVDARRRDIEHIQKLEEEIQELIRYKHFFYNYKDLLLCTADGEETEYIRSLDTGFKES